MSYQDSNLIMPRPVFQENDVPKKTKRLMMGTKTSGVSVDVTKKGVSFNGYYTNTTGDIKYACVREPVEITWEEFDKIKESVFKRAKPKKRKKKKSDPDKVDEPTKKYLDTLPIVTINKAKYYIDAEKRERRPVRTPSQVFNF